MFSSINFAIYFLGVTLAIGAKEALTAQLFHSVIMPLRSYPRSHLNGVLRDYWPLGSVSLLVKGFKIVIWRTYIKMEHQNLREVMLLF